MIPTYHRALFDILYNPRCSQDPTSFLAFDTTVPLLIAMTREYWFAGSGRRLGDFHDDLDGKLELPWSKASFQWSLGEADMVEVS